MKYLNDYLEKWCSCDLHSLICQSRNPAKEISESMGAYVNLKSFIDRKDAHHHYIFIGDGSLAITAALFAFLTKGKCIAIDPLLNNDKVNLWLHEKQVSNFFCFKTKFQDFAEDRLYEFTSNEKYTLICVHAHIDLVQLIDYFPNWDYLYTNPCCYKEKQTFSLAIQKERDIEVVKYCIDENILSDKNEVVVYKNKRK
jgi:hypothetical protein